MSATSLSSPSTSDSFLTTSSTDSSPSNSTASSKKERLVSSTEDGLASPAQNPLGAGTYTFNNQSTPTRSSNATPKVFARSAAKRESVMALGSIEHLQDFFKKTGLAAKKAPFQGKKGLVPALGVHIPGPSTSSLNSPHSPHHTGSLSAAYGGGRPRTASTFHRSPTGATNRQRNNPLLSPHVRDPALDAEWLLDAMIEDLEKVAGAWGLPGGERHDRSLGMGQDSDTPFDVLGVLRTTMRAVMSARSWVLSLPEEDEEDMQEDSRARSPNLVVDGTTPTAINPHPSELPEDEKPAKLPHSPISLIRVASLDLQVALREMEESLRLVGEQPGSPSSPTSSNGAPLTLALAQPHSEHLASSDMTFEGGDEGLQQIQFSVVKVPLQGKGHAGRDHILVWEEDDDGWSDDDEDIRERWEDIVFGTLGSHQYRPVRLQDLKERADVEKWVDTVDSVLKQTSLNVKGRDDPSVDGEKTWVKLKRRREGKRRTAGGVENAFRVMTLSEEAEEAEEAPVLPVWAHDDAFLDPLERAYALLRSHLPSSLQQHLATFTPSEPESRTVFLRSLSSGQLLCMAYNVVVRRSRKPWGYVSRSGIHDILALEAAGGDGEARKMWTFRKTDNLRLWIGGLKIRYVLPIQLPTAALSSVLSSVKGPTAIADAISSAAIAASKQGLRPAGPRQSVSRSSSPGPTGGVNSSIMSKLKFTPATPSGNERMFFPDAKHIIPSISKSRSASEYGEGVDENGRLLAAPTPMRPSSFSSSTSPSSFGMRRVSSPPLQGPFGPSTTSQILGQNDLPFPAKSERGILFDARIVAKEADGWQDMLQAVLLEWVKEVVREVKDKV